MNRFLLLLFFIGFAAGCNKPEDKKCPPALLGKWTYTEYFYSTGAPGQWHAVEPANQVIEFHSDGSFTTVASFLKGATRYEVDSNTVRFLPSSQPAGYWLMRYDVTSIPCTLILTPIDPICIEGCGHKFKR